MARMKVTSCRFANSVCIPSVSMEWTSCDETKVDSMEFDTELGMLILSKKVFGLDRQIHVTRENISQMEFANEQGVKPKVARGKSTNAGDDLA